MHKCQIQSSKLGILEKKESFIMKNTNFETESGFFLSYTLIITFDIFLPTHLFGTTCLLIFAKFYFLHAYLALHVYLEH